MLEPFCVWGGVSTHRLSSEPPGHDSQFVVTGIKLILPICVADLGEELLDRSSTGDNRQRFLPGDCGGGEG